MSERKKNGISAIVALALLAALSVATCNYDGGRDAIAQTTVTKSRLPIEGVKWGYGTYTVPTSTGGTNTRHKFSPINVLARGVSNTGSSDCADSLNAIITEVGIAGGGTIYLPAGTYRLKTPSDGTSEAYSGGNGSFIHLKAGVCLVGDGRQTVLRVAGNAGHYVSVIHQDNHAASLGQLSISNLTIDQNSDSNAVAAVSDLTDNPRFAVEVYASRDLVIDNVWFKNPSGTNTVYVNGKASTVNTSVTNCLFSDVGGESVNYDHSTIYIHGDGMKIVGNRFYGEKLYGRAYGTRTAIETHGPNQVVIGNSVSKYRTFANITGISYAESRNITVQGNTGDNLISGITLWSRAYVGHYASTDLGITNCAISGNTFHICNADSAEGHTRHGIGFAKNNGTHPLDVRNLTISNNNISYEPQPTAYTVTLDPYSAAIGLIVDSAKADSLTFQNTVVSGNVIRYAPTTGIRIAAKGRNVTISDNQIISPARTTYTTAILDAHRSGIMAYPSGGRSFNIVNNYIRADTSSTKFGIYLGSTAACTLMNVVGNICSGVPAGYAPVYLTDLANLRSSQFNISLNVREWGAAGTQGNKDAAVIAAVVEAADDAGGGDVYFPEGHYITGGTVTADSANVRMTGFVPADSLVGGLPRLIGGSGTPEASIWGPIGSIYQNKTGSVGREVFFKASGTGNTLWLRRDQLRRVYADSISEYTSAAGAWIDGVLAKDSILRTTSARLDTVAMKTALHGVVIDPILPINSTARAADDSLGIAENVIHFSGQTGNVFCTLPTYATVPIGKTYTIINCDATATDSVFVEANGAEFLNGLATRRAVGLRGYDAADGYFRAMIMYVSATVGWARID